MTAAACSLNALSRPLADVPHVAGEVSVLLHELLLQRKLCVLCVAGSNHWRNVALDPIRGMVTLWDPAGLSSLRAAGSALRDAAQRLADRAGWEVRLPSRLRRAQRVSRCPAQLEVVDLQLQNFEVDWWSCGDYSVRFAAVALAYAQAGRIGDATLGRMIASSFPAGLGKDCRTLTSAGAGQTHSEKNRDTICSLRRGLRNARTMRLARNPVGGLGPAEHGACSQAVRAFIAPGFLHVGWQSRADGLALLAAESGETALTVFRRLRATETYLKARAEWRDAVGRYESTMDVDE